MNVEFEVVQWDFDYTVEAKQRFESREDATSLAAELNAREEAFAEMKAERDRLRAAVEYFFQVYDCLTDNGKFASRPYCIGKDVIDGLRIALSANESLEGDEYEKRRAAYADKQIQIASNLRKTYDHNAWLENLANDNE
jgi:hypothetical protein